MLQYICREDPILLQSRSEPQHNNNGVMEPENKGAAITVSISDYNTYSEHKLFYIKFDNINLGTVGEPVSGKATKDFTGFLQIPGLRTRVPSYHVRELVRGQFVVKSKDIVLLDCIGQGACLALKFDAHIYDDGVFIDCTSYSGEFGIVYKARLRSSNKDVAVKTLKGLQFFCC